VTDVAQVRSRDAGLGTVDEARASTAWLQQRLRSADRVSVLARLASIIAHELGTPLNVIAGRAGLIGEEPDASSFAQKNASIIGEQVRSITDLLQRIVDAGRRHGLDEKPVRVHTVAEKAVVLLAPLAEQMKVSLSAEGDRALATCIDEQRTLQGNPSSNGVWRRGGASGTRSAWRGGRSGRRRGDGPRRWH
jgi:signal transduction histidine kinase